MNIQFPLPITKMSGAGNDFIVIDHRSLSFPASIHGQLAQAVCRRRFSAGADGLILIENSDTDDFRWQFYNSDGSTAEMCGNGARCAARYAYRHGIAGKKMTFGTLAGSIMAEIVGGQEHVSIKMPEPSAFRMAEPIVLDGHAYDIYSINTGVPHAVIFCDTDRISVEAWGRRVRYDAQFDPDGTNVNFVRTNGNGDLLVTTYERGVEEVTMACGTGVVASVLIAARCDMVESPVYVTTAGGEQLAVNFEREDEAFSDIYLQGAARFIYEGTLQEEALL